MNTEPSVYWHYAVSLTHRKVALATFLHSAHVAHLQVYYSVHDPAALVIAEIAAVVGSAAFAWHTGSDLTPTGGWVWLRSHAAHEVAYPATTVPPRAVLCLESVTNRGGLPALPPDHQAYITGMTWPAG